MADPAEKPTIERIAETLDKFEEDILNADYPGIRGERHVVLRFGEPLEVPAQRESRNAVGEWTDRLEGRVQGLLDDINAEHSPGTSPKMSEMALARPLHAPLGAE